MKFISCNETFNSVNFKIKLMFHSSWFTSINLDYGMKKPTLTLIKDKGSKTNRLKCYQ